MAHNINYNAQTGKHSFFSVKEKAWHGLGQIVNRYPTSAEAVQFAGLDYTVEKRPLFTYDRGNFIAGKETAIIIPEITVPNYYATVRSDSDQVLGVVGNDYEVVQNRDAFAFFDAIVGGNEGVLYETAGALGQGERIFITAKLPGYIKVGREDLIEKYLFLTTSHDGYGSITAAFTPVRVVCQNTLNAALNDMTGVIKIRHTQSAQDRLKQAHKVMGISNQLSMELEQTFNHWSKVGITDSEVKQLIQLAMVPNKEVFVNLQNGKNDALSTSFLNICDNVYEYAFTNPTQQEATTKGTLFGAYNAVTGYFQNVKTYKNEEAKLKSILFGAGFNKTQSAFNLCSEFEKSGNEIFTVN